MRKEEDIPSMWHVDFTCFLNLLDFQTHANTYKHTIKMCPWKTKGLGTQQFPGTVEILEFFIHTTCQQTWTFMDSKV